MTVHAFCINGEIAGLAHDPLSAAIIVVTMDGLDLAKIQAALGAMCEHAPTANIRNDLMPILAALDNLKVV